MIDLNPSYLETVKGILAEHVRECEVRAFGSRATWSAKDYSDLDLAIVGVIALDCGTLGQLKEAFEQSDLPMRVDVLDWHTITDSFRKVIEQDYVVVQKSADGKSAVQKEQGITSEWRDMPFSDAVLVNPSVHLESSKTYPFVNMASINADCRSIYSSEQREFRGGGSKFKSGDTLMARITPCLENGKIARYCTPDTSGTAHGSTEFIVIRGRPGITDTEYAYYLTQWEEVRNYAISQMAGTSGRQRVPTESLDHLPIHIPPLPEQRTIAHILGKLDDKIELNRRMNETLEAMARALFKDWFVDFGPVRAKMEGRDTGLPKHLADFFPDRLVDSELGEIPEGWEVKTLRDLCHLPQYGFTASAQDEPVGPKFLRITDINKKAWIEWASVPYCKLTEKDFTKYRLNRGDVVIARMADPGHGVLIEENLDSVFASYLIRFRPLHEHHSRLLQYWLRSSRYWELVLGRGAGTTRVSLNAKVLSEFSLVVPTASVTEFFDKHIASLRARVVGNASEIKTLAALRDTLIPKLISGELRVRNVERRIGEAKS